MPAARIIGPLTASQAYQREYREENREKIASYQSKYMRSPRRKTWAKGYYQRPEVKGKTIARQRLRNRTPVSKRRAYENQMWKKYRLTLEDLARMLEAQQGVCAGCENRLLFDKYTHVDHCHRTEEVRGLLCNDCNITLGTARDSPATLRRLADYLERSHGR